MDSTNAADLLSCWQKSKDVVLCASKMPSGITQPAKLFRPSSVGAGASLLTVVLLMLGNHFLVLTFFICIVYAVVPCSLWRKHRAPVWRGSIVITCATGFGIIALGVIGEWVGLQELDEDASVIPGFASMKVAFLSGVVFLPLACIGSLHSLFAAMRSRRRLTGRHPRSP